MNTRLDAPTPAATVPTVGNMVVARFRDGRKIKGSTQDFAPNKNRFHVHPADENSAIEIDVAELKALFFVKTYDGNAVRHDAYSFEQVKGHGRKATVTFYDGETMAGYTMGYHADKPGFFMVPADADNNNARVFVLNAAVERIQMQ